MEGTLRGSAWSQWSKGDKAAKIPGKKDGAGGMSVIVLRDVVPEAAYAEGWTVMVDMEAEEPLPVIWRSWHAAWKTHQMEKQTS